MRAWVAGEAWPELAAVAFPGRDLNHGPAAPAGLGSAERAACWDFFEGLPPTTARHARVAADATTVVMHRPEASGLIP